MLELSEFFKNPGLAAGAVPSVARRRAKSARFAIRGEITCAASVPMTGAVTLCPVGQDWHALGGIYADVIGGWFNKLWVELGMG